MENFYHSIQMEVKKKKVYTMKIEKMVNGLIIMGMGIKRWKKSIRMGLWFQKKLGMKMAH